MRINYRHSKETRKKISIAHIGKKRRPHTKKTRKKISIANTGKHPSKKTRKKLSLTHMGHFPSNETRKKLRIAHRGLICSEETRKKIRIAHKKNFSNPIFVARYNVWINKRYRAGIFISVKNKCSMWFQSSYEKCAYIELERDNRVRRYKRCNFSIPYPYKGEVCRYIPDICVEYVGGLKIIIEVKPLRRTYEIRNVIKALAGKKYCQKNNMKYLIWTEDDVFNK